ncbi:DUF6308 family protein [Streptomyces sp. NPDC048481]|uniref:DUF6308 family protein n=1 Tax=Streptomyces sp. NPDC048481 TaxID=3365557 RepID=UPI003712802A
MQSSGRTTVPAPSVALHRQLLVPRQVAGMPETVSALRVCDVAVWMGHRAEGHAFPRRPRQRGSTSKVLACEGPGRSRGVAAGVGEGCGLGAGEPLAARS